MKLFSVLFAAVFFAACAGARIDSVERQMKSDLDDLRSIQAEHTADLNTIRQELREVSGKVEELQYVAMGRTKELERTLNRLGSRVPPPPGVPEKLLNSDEEQIASLTGPAADTYKRGLNQLRAGDFEGGRETFSRFVQDNPGTAFTDNALFWLGICYGKLGQYDRAVVAFSDVFQSYPAENMVPASLYHLSETFVKMGSIQDAKLTLQKLIDEHPKSSFNRKARNRLRELKRRRR